MNYPKGSEWRKWDLHLHTPSSYDYTDKSITNKDIIDNLKRNNVSVVAITDHQIIDKERIKELKRLAGNDITILPGIELCSESRGEDPIHFMGIFDENIDIDYVWGDLYSKSNIAQQKAGGKKPHEIYCELRKTCIFIKELGGIVSIHAGSKSNSIEQITNSLPVKMAEKEDIAKNIDIFELGQEKDQDGYREIVFKKIGPYPMIICSDNHKAKGYVLKQNCWIKADPTFEGLKQIIYEPEERVRIQEIKPEEKSSYHIINRVEFNNNDGQKEIVYFNQNLNSIIGSRANGKSNLLKNIAFSIDPNQCHSKDITGLDFLQLSNFKLFWEDGSTNSLNLSDKKEKGVLFIPQGYLGKLLDKEKQFDSFLANLFGNKLDFKESMEIYRKFEDQNTLDITSLIRELLFMTEARKQKQIELTKLGKKSDLEDEIKRINDYIREFNKKGSSITQAELEKYKDLTNQRIDKNSELIKVIKDINSFLRLKDEDVITAEMVYDYEFSEEYIKIIMKKIKESDREFKTKFIEKEIVKLKQLKNDIELSITDLDRTIKPLKSKLEKHKALLDLTKNLEGKREILKKIIALIQEVEDLTKNLENKIDAVTKLYSLFSIRYKELNIDIEKLEFSNFKVITDFDEISFVNFLEENINYHNSLDFKEDKQKIYKNTNQLLNDPVNWGYEEKDFVEIQKQLLEAALYDILLLKSGRNKDNMLQDLFKNRFKINFSKSITSEVGEEFNNMSDGEKMIALLEFIFKFDDYNYPVLLDQPEDDLDVKAISKHVVNFIEKQKRQRQIIIASHNGNLVVCGDSEEIVVANKSRGENPNFNYVSGSIENPEMRKQIIEILEGGEEAIRKRKNKLNIKS